MSTVSRALRNASDVNADTKKAVMLLSQELNYQPNRLALSLRQKQTHSIGVIVPNLDYVLSTMVRGMDEVALEAGYTVMVCQSNESFKREVVNTKRLLDSLVDGFIISVSSETKSFDHFKKIQERNIPMVVFDRITPDLNAPCVRLDNEDGGFQATEHLIEQGYQHIAILTGPKNLGIRQQQAEWLFECTKEIQN
jgi:LacI family transcriptional regulator